MTDFPVVPLKGYGKRKSWQFGFQGWGDNVNFVYVACTRAKKALSIPKNMAHFLDDCDMLHSFMQAWGSNEPSKEENISLFHLMETMNRTDARSVFQQICAPVWTENSICQELPIAKALLQDKEYEENEGPNGVTPCSPDRESQQSLSAAAGNRPSKKLKLESAVNA